MTFSNKKNIPEVVNVSLLDEEKIKSLYLELGDSWTLVELKFLKKNFKFQGFSKALEFVNDIATCAEDMDHHPKITIDFNSVFVELSTKKVLGLTLKDFMMAEKIDALFTSDTGKLP